MSLSLIMNGCFGGITMSSGGSCNSFKGISKMGNSAVITGTMMILLVWSFVGDCGGNPFQSNGQDEVEEDTSQGSLKEKFSPFALSLRSPVTHFQRHIENLDNADDAEDVERNFGGFAEGIRGKEQHIWPTSTLNNNGDRQRQYHLLRHLSLPSSSRNYGIVEQKRSLGIRPLSLSTASRDILDGKDGGGRNLVVMDEQKQDAPFYEPSSPPSPGGGGSSSDINSSSSESSTALRIRQKLLNLRNQYGDKWFAFVGPYAYRKRQILYRQCFFNPISCF